MKNTLFLSFLALWSLNLVAQEAPLQIEPIAENLYAFTTYQKFNGVVHSSNGVYLVTDAGVVLFNTPWDSTQNIALLDSIDERHNREVVRVYVTHWHDDRAGGLEFFNSIGVPTYASSRTNTILRQKKLATAVLEFDDHQSVDFGGQRFDLAYLGAGHTTDNLVVWFPKQRVLDGGCLVKSSEATTLGFTGDADLKAWPHTIKKVQKQFGAALIVIPGHDSWKPQGHLENTLQLLLQSKGGSQP